MLQELTGSTQGSQTFAELGAVASAQVLTEALGCRPLAGAGTCCSIACIKAVKLLHCFTRRMVTMMRHPTPKCICSPTGCIFILFHKKHAGVLTDDAKQPLSI